jgi:hypothetical protein
MIPRVSRALRAGSAALAAVALAVFLLLALVHLRDNYHVDHVTGAWMGLTAYADGGVLYPPLQQNGYFAGTRYGPLGIVVNTVGAKISGEYLTSGKVLALLVMCTLLTGGYVLARRLGCGRTVSLAAVGAVIATFTALFAGTTIYGDALAVTLQIWALVIIRSRSDPRGAVAAGVLAALAVTAKVSGVWGLATVFVWLLARERRRLPAFLAAAGATAVAGFGLATLASNGRIGENIFGLTGSGVSGLRSLLVDSPSKWWDYLLQYSPATVALLPFAAVAIGVAAAKRRIEIVDVALVLATLQTLVVLSDVGAGFNHLLDVVVLVPIVVASAHSRLATHALGHDDQVRNAFGLDSGVTTHALCLLLVVAMAAGTVVSLVDVRHDVREAATMIARLESPVQLRAPAISNQLAEPYFTEDASLAVERGQRPVALDSFMLLRILHDDPALERSLIARFDRKEFKSVVLITDLDLGDPWWSRSHLGLDVARAIDRNYRFVRYVQGPTFRYRIFEPREG